MLLTMGKGNGVFNCVAEGILEGGSGLTYKLVNLDIPKNSINLISPEESFTLYGYYDEKRKIKLINQNRSERRYEIPDVGEMGGIINTSPVIKRILDVPRFILMDDFRVFFNPDFERDREYVFAMKNHALHRAIKLFKNKDLIGLYRRLVG